MPGIQDVLSVEDRIYYKHRLIEFIEDIIFHEDAKDNGGTYYITDQQLPFLEAILNKRKVAAKAGRGVGKTAMLAWIIIWFLSVHDDPKIICTSPAYPQMMAALWPEIDKWLRRSLVAPCFVYNQERVYRKDNISNAWAVPRTTTQPEGIAGVHSDDVLIVVDEASGIEEDVYNTIIGSLTQPNNKIAMMSNPTRTSGAFHDIFARDTNVWERFTFNAEDSPLVDKEFVNEMASRYGTDHNIYKIHVLGEFPSEDPDAFIGIESIQKAVDRAIEHPEGDVQFGIDVARKGNDLSVICIRHGMKVQPLKTRKKTTIPQLVAWTITQLKSFRAQSGYTETIRVCVDDTGVGGGVTDLLELRSRELNIDVIPCNFGGKGDDIYDNEASKMWGTVKDHIDYIDLPDDRFLIEELSARRWEATAKGKILIEPKKKFKKQFGSSPDRADALVLAFSNKLPPTRVMSMFDQSSDTVKFDEFVRGGYASVFLNNQLETAVVWGFMMGSTLTITDEFVGSLTEATQKLGMHAPYKKCIANSRAFKQGTDDLYVQLRRNGVRLKEDYKFNLFGSISRMASMFRHSSLKIAKKCTRTIDQVQSWASGVGHAKQEQEFPLCFAILHMIGDLSNGEQLPVLHTDVSYNQMKINGEPVRKTKEEFDYMSW